MKLYVARHGETEWNAVERLCGHTDLPLNETGKAQADALAKQLQAEGLSLDLVIASPLIRAQQTAGIIAQQLSLRVETDARLIEQNYGDYEGDTIHNPDFIWNKSQFAFRYPNGESMMQVAQRVYGFLDELKGRNLSRVLLVSHGGTCRVLHTYFGDETNDEFFRWRMKNAEVRRYTL